MNDKLKRLEEMLLETRALITSPTAIENIDACIAMIERMKSIAKFYEEAQNGNKTLVAE